MENQFKKIYEFNKKAELLEKPYSDFLEPSFLIEEALEDLGTDNLYRVLLESEKRASNEVPEKNTPKHIARALVNCTDWSSSNITDLQRFDKQIDAIVYAVGGAYKLGITPQQLEAGIAAVMHSNMKKVGAGKDEHGKALKPDNWEEIEAEQAKKLQAILDKRQN